jgi:hypothetical protein
MSQTPRGQINGSDPDQLAERNRALEVENQELKQKIFDHYEWSREKRKELLTEIEALRSISVEYAILSFFRKRIEKSTGLLRQAIELGHQKTRVSLVVAPARISRSVDRLLDDLALQTHKLFEVVVVTAEDTIPANSKDVDLRVIKVPPELPHSARVRTGFSNASGDVLSHLEESCRLVPSSLANVVLFFNQNPSVQISHAARLRADADGWSLLETPILLDFQTALKARNQSLSEFFFRRSAFDFLSGIDSRVEAAWQFAAVLRLLLRYPSRLNPMIVTVCTAGSDCDPARRAASDASCNRVASLVEEELRTHKWIWKRSLGALEYARAKIFKRGDPSLWFPSQLTFSGPAHEPLDSGITLPVEPILEEPADRFLFTLRTIEPSDSQSFGVFLHSPRKIAVISPFRNGSSPPPSALAEAQETDWRFSALATLGDRRNLTIRTRRGAEHQKVQPSRAGYSHRLASLLSLTPASGRVLDFHGCFHWATPWKISFPDHAVDVLTDWGRWLTAMDYNAFDGTPLGKLQGRDVLFHAIHLPGILQVSARPRHLLRVLASLLRHQGLLILSTPNLDSTEARVFGPAWEHWQPATNAYIYSVSALRSLLHHCGFREVRFETFSDDSWTAASLERFLKSNKKDDKISQLGLEEGALEAVSQNLEFRSRGPAPPQSTARQASSPPLPPQSQQFESPLSGDMILAVFSKLF